METEQRQKGVSASGIPAIAQGKRTCVFTIVSRNYLHFARTLMASVKATGAPCDLVVCLCDRKDDTGEAPECFRILPIETLPIPELGAFVLQYSIIELNTAVKPFVFDFLFEQCSYDKVIYFDPDIQVFGSLNGMLDMLDGHNLVLTPHLTGFLDDGKHPDELAVLRSGTYNLGFLAASKCDEVRRFLAWWQGKMLHDCTVDLEHGLFVDQKWMDLAPALFDGVLVNRDPGWNVAYWNLNHRKLETTGKEPTANGRPLVFFHFSGISPDGKLFSKHQNRYSMENVPDAVRQLAQSYCEQLRENGAAFSSECAYGFGFLSDGTPIPDCVRRVFRTARTADAEAVKVQCSAVTKASDDKLNFRKDDEAKLIAYANAVPPGYSVLTRAALALYEGRGDLHETFPALGSGSERDFAQWFVNHAGNEDRVPDLFIRPVRNQLHSSAGNAENGRACDTVFGRLYAAGWACRKLAYPFTTLKFRQRIDRILSRMAYGSLDKTRQTDRQAATMRAAGLNIVGYARAESGVGEACRSTIRSAQAAGMPFAVVEFSDDSLSRMEAQLPAGAEVDPRFGVNLFHVNAAHMPQVRRKVGQAFFRDRFNIAVWYWELPEFPDEWLPSFDGLQEIWVGSQFCQNAIAAKSRIPVVRMPPCVDSQSVAADRGRFGIPEGRFVFLCMADALSSLERKNPVGAIRAYQASFPGGSSSACLVVKLINAPADSEVMTEIRQLAERDPGIILINRYMDRQELNALVCSSDCLVSLHRSEGFGLPIAETMCLGKPVIATGWSGNMDI